MIKRSTLLIWLLLGCCYMPRAQSPFIDDQFPRAPLQPYKDPAHPYVAYRRGELWGLCNRQKNILIEPCAKTFPSYKEDAWFRYFTETNDSEPNSFRQFTRIYDRNFNLLRSAYTINGGEMQRLSNGRFLFDARYVFDSLLNLLYTSPYTMAYTGNGYSQSWPGLLSEYHYLEKDRYSLKICTEGLETLFDDVVQGRHGLQVYKAHRWLELVPLRDPGYALNMETQCRIPFKEGASGLVPYGNFVYRVLQPGQQEAYTFFTRGFALIADSVKGFEDLPGGRLLIRKKSGCLLVDSLGKQTRLPFEDVLFSGGYFICYDQVGIVNIADSAVRLLLKGNYTLLCHPQNVRAYLAMPKKFVAIGRKLAIAGSRDSILARFDQFDDVNGYVFTTDTLFDLTRTLPMKVRQPDGKWADSKKYIHKLVSVSNIDDTPSGCDRYTLHFNKALKLYYLLVTVNHLQGLRLPNGKELLPAAYANMYPDDSKPVLVVHRQDGLRQLFDLRSGRLSDSAFAMISEGPGKTWYAGTAGSNYQYYNCRIDSDLSVHPFDSLLVKANSIWLKTPGMALAIGYRSKTHQAVLLDLRRHRTLAVLDSRAESVRDVTELKLGTQKLFRVYLTPDDGILLDASEKCIGREYNEQQAYHFDGTEAVLHPPASSFLLLDYKSNRIVSAGWMSLKTGARTPMFRGRSYEGIEHDYYNSPKYPVFYKDSAVTMMDTAGRILAGPAKGKWMTKTGNSFFEVMMYGSDSARIYHGRQLIFTGLHGDIGIGDRFLFVTKREEGSPNRYAIADSTGRFAVPGDYIYLQSHNLAWRYDSVLFIAQRADTKKYGLINLKNEAILPFEYDSILPRIGSWQVMGFYKEGRLWEFNLYSHMVSRLDAANAELGYRPDEDDRGFYGIKDMRGNLVVKHIYPNPLHRELYWSNILPPGIFYTTKQIKGSRGEPVFVKCYVDEDGTEYWKD